MEREVLMTGIGGQGIQLASQVLARAALAEGRQVQLFGSYSGMMRGGSTETTLIIAEGTLEAPPTVDRAWAGVLVHPEYAAAVAARVRPGGVIVRNATLFDDPPPPGVRLLDVPGTGLAVAAGHIMTVSMVLVGALAALSSLVSLDSLRQALAESLPPYRAQHVLLNEAALQAGFDAASDEVDLVGASAW